MPQGCRVGFNPRVSNRTRNSALRGEIRYPVYMTLVTVKEVENRASRPLSRTQATCRSVSSMVGDHMRILTVLMLAFLRNSRYQSAVLYRISITRLQSGRELGAAQMLYDGWSGSRTTEIGSHPEWRLAASNVTYQAPASSPAGAGMWAAKRRLRHIHIHAVPTRLILEMSRSLRWELAGRVAGCVLIGLSRPIYYLGSPEEVPFF
ncbi:hypothetical protein P175DRAFT_0523277 [Aspergillus ochraceoroseus IBT 24754]|uniref:Uncharacterized protein n=1 Tax=Aspergillus ochraceoroseus IBT 24754 TaxID=1392256 RepID=A0A2T5M0R5_9EURO|nr:uncharacterized protein P175DRAFT_0523277 [Aspergillus ochraceoroseus IBT 24754]PTU22119.1 hypothetical protein P175DRAFT_0523277 [Aspergillus ochraceoroseus IBT 24754]